MKHIAWCGAVLFVLIAVGLASGQRDFARVQIKTTHVAGNIHMLDGAGGNIGISVGDDGVVMIDDQFAPLADKIRKAVEKVAGKKKPIRFLVNTHMHGDHTGGNAYFGKEASIIAHDNVRVRLLAQSKDGLPVITFDDSLSIHMNGEQVKVVHFPTGHTDGDSIIFFEKSNVVHMGDQFFSGMFPYVDLNSGGNVVGFTKNVEKVLEMVPDDVKIIPGHGPLSSVDDLHEFHRMLVETTDYVRKKMEAGNRFEKIRTGGLPDEWKSWSWGFVTEERWIDAVYRSLQ